MNKKFFSYLFKSKKSLNVTVAVSYIIVFVSCLLLFNDGRNSYLIPIFGSTIVLGFLSYILIPIVFNFVHSKKAVDSYFSLPVTRKELLITSEVYIDLLILVPYLILMIVAFLYGISTHGINSLVTYSSIVFFTSISSIAIVMFNTAVYLKANSMFDGIVLIVAYALLPIFSLIALAEFQNNYVIGFDPIQDTTLISYLSLPGAMIATLVSRFTWLYERIDNGFMAFASTKLYICVLWHIVLSIYVFSKDFIKRKVERAENISNEFFSYPFVIYAYTFIFVFSLTISLISDFHRDSIILYVILLIIFLIANFVYRRKIKIVIKDVAFFLLTILVSIGFGYYANKTQGFGLSHLYDKNPENVAITYRKYLAYDEGSQDKIIKLLSDNGYNTDFYELEFNGLIKNSELTSKKAAYDFIEEKRLEAIDDFYAKDGNYQESATLIIKTNVDETLKDEDLYKLESNGNKCCIYNFLQPFTIEELQNLSSIMNSDVKITFYNEKYIDGITLTLDSLIK